MAVKKCFVQGNVETNTVYMTSGLQPPTNVDWVYRTEVSAYMQPFSSGGSIEHVFLGGKVSNNVKKKIISKMFETPMNYMTLSPTLTVCTKCHTKKVGEYYKCPNCGDDEHIMIYSRIIGYTRPIVSGKVKIEHNMINGDENYWQDSRRVDWVERDKLK